jgi:hypothetical protein
MTASFDNANLKRFFATAPVQEAALFSVCFPLCLGSFRPARGGRDTGLIAIIIAFFHGLYAAL